MARVRLYRTNRVKMAFSEPAACRRDCPQGESKRGYRGILIGVQGNLRVSTRESATPYREISLCVCFLTTEYTECYGNVVESI